MHKKLFGLLFITSKLIYPAIGCDYKFLDAEADTYDNIIWSHEKLPDLEEIKKSLFFVREGAKFKFDYGKAENFLSFYEEARQTITNPKFLTFAQRCKEIYETAADESLKIASYMLLAQVKEKSLKYIKLSKKRNKLKESRAHPALSPEEVESVINSLLDRGRN